MSGLNDQDARALIYLAMRIRSETHGAGPWQEPGLVSVVAKLKGRSLAMTAEHIIRHAADPKAKSPGVLLGAFTPARIEPSNRIVPKRDEACGLCGGWKGSCACSRVEKYGTDDEPVTDEDRRLVETIRARRHNREEA